MNGGHKPVLLPEVLTVMAGRSGLFIDCTLGRGGYTQALLEQDPRNTVIAIDRDAEAICWAEEHLKPRYPQRLNLLHDRFGNLAHLSSQIPPPLAQGIVFDLGVSSPQLDQAERGFSFMREGPLDMGMGLNNNTAATFVNTAPEEEIADVLYRFGEERRARKIAQRIVLRRQRAPFETTQDLVQVIQEVVPRSPSGVHPATRTFQAIRIWVNQELEELRRALDACPSLLTPGGQLVVVSFHSLEDRLVKQYFLTHSRIPASPNRHSLRSPREELSSNSSLLFAVSGKQPLLPSKEACAENPRARSARLRYGTRLPNQGEALL